MRDGTPSASILLAAWLSAPTHPARVQDLAAVAPVPAPDLARVPLAALPLLLAHGVRLTALKPEVRLALLCFGAERCLEPPCTPSEQRLLALKPFAMRIAHGDALVELPERPEAWAILAHEPAYHRWAAGIDAAIRLDLRRTHHINSVFVAWLLQLVQAAQPQRVLVCGSNAQAGAQLRQLRLDHLITLV